MFQYLISAARRGKGEDVADIEESGESQE